MNMLDVLLIVLVVAACIQFFYFLFFFLRVSWYRNKTPKSIPLSPVTVIICAKDEATNLSKNLPAILEQDYQKYEVLVVNDNSVDQSLDILYDLSFKYPHLTIRDLKQESRVLLGKKYALTIGLKAAKYDIVMLTDADCVPSSKSWLKEMRLKFEESKDVVLGYAPYKKIPGLLNKCIRYETFWSAMQYLSFAMAGIPYMGVGRNLAYRKKLFFDKNVFAKNMHLASGDDDLFINEVATARNTKVQLSKESFVLSEPKKTWDEWFHQKRRHLTTGKHYRLIHQFLLAVFHLSHIVFYLTFILLIVYDTRYEEILVIFGFRYLFMLLIFYPAMKRLNSLDLFLWFPLMDLLLNLYYIVMSPSLFNKKTTTWK